MYVYEHDLNEIYDMLIGHMDINSAVKILHKIDDKIVEIVDRTESKANGLDD